MAKVIGTAAERIDGELVPQVCRGTMADDIASSGFPFRIMFVEHDDGFPMHGHEYAELVVVLDGHAVHNTEFEQYPIERGDAFVITGDRQHGFVDASGLHLCNIQFDPQWFFDAAGDLNEMMGFHGFFDLETRAPEGKTFRQRLRLDSSELSEIESLLRRMDAEYRGGQGGRQSVISGLFIALAVRLSRIYERERAAQHPAVAAAAVAAFIRRNFRRQIKIDELAEIAGLSATQLQRSFKRFYSTTPVNMINRLRVESACEMLADSNRDLSNIAEELGYSSASFFSTQFRQFMGMSPRQFRKQRLELIDAINQVSVASVGVGESD